MRSVLLISLVLLSAHSIAQSNARAETVTRLQQALAGKPASTGLCILRTSTNTELKDKDFSSRIESTVSWQYDTMIVQNDISENGQYTETYRYFIPATAITAARLSNCQNNKHNIVDAYKDRPLFITARKGSVRTIHTRFAKNGKATIEKRINDKEVDWNSVIPIVLGKQGQPDVEDKIEAGFRELAAMNTKNVATR